jgi:hypothetical protein
MMPDEVVVLKGDVVVSVAALRLGRMLEERGVQVVVGDDGSVTLTPSNRVPTADIPALRRHKGDLATLTGYCMEPPR